MIAPLLAVVSGLALAGGPKVVADPGTARAYAPRRVALLVGVDGYRDPSLQSLSFAAKDASDLAAVLRDPSAGGYDAVYVVPPSETTRSGILSSISKVTADLQRDDTFLLYLSGHGTLEFDPIDGTRLVFLPSDATLDEARRSGISVDWIEDTVARLAPRRRVLILDTCHNGRSKSGLSAQTAARLKTLKGDPPPPNPVAEVSESEARLFAAEYYQAAMEDAGLKNGVYTHFLLQALTDDRDAADLDRDGLVDVIEAHAYARDGTIRYTGGAQVPRAEYSIVGNEEIFLSGDPGRRRRAESALFSAYSNLLASARLLVDGKPRGVLPGTIAVEPGRRRIRVETADGRSLVDETVEVRAGRTTSIEAMLEPEPAQWSVLGGASIIGGFAGDHLVPLGGELLVGWRPPARGAARFALHGRASLGAGDLADLQVSGTAGLAAVGGSVGWSPWPDRLLIGPQAELIAPWRTYRYDDASIWQSGVSVGAGGFAQLEQTVGQHNSLLVRYDLRVMPMTVYDGRGIGIAQSVSAGLTFR
jgi:uncharacterized caspase-like protein